MRCFYLHGPAFEKSRNVFVCHSRCINKGVSIEKAVCHLSTVAWKRCLKLIRGILGWKTKWFALVCSSFSFKLMSISLSIMDSISMTIVLVSTSNRQAICLIGSVVQTPHTARFRMFVIDWPSSGTQDKDLDLMVSILCIVRGYLNDVNLDYRRSVRGYLRRWSHCMLMFAANNVDVLLKDRRDDQSQVYQNLLTRCAPNCKSI